MLTKFFCQSALSFSRLHADRRANVVVIFALALVPLMMAVGLVVDYTNVTSFRSQLQHMLDAAVLAGAREAGEGDKRSAATAVFETHVETTLNTLPSTLDVPPEAEFEVNGDGMVSGTATASYPMVFAGFFGMSRVPVTVTAAAVASSPASRVCVLLVHPTKSQALLVNSGANVIAPDCEFHVRSTANPAAIFNGGTNLNVKTVCIKGSRIIKNGGANPPAQTDCNAVSDPLAGKLPTVSASACNYSNQTYNSGNVSLNPGTYCGWTNFNGSGNLTLKPGLYVIKDGAMTFNSSWTVTGAGVTFYLANQNATLTFNGNVNTKLSAPASGKYADILMFEPNGLPNTNLPINGTNGSSLEGLLYLPSRDVTINSVSNVSSRKLTMVFSTLILNAVNWTFEPGNISIAAGGQASQTVRLVH